MRKAYIYFPLLAGLLLAGCDDDTTEPNPTLSIAVGEAITLVQGQSGTTTITVTRGGGYDDEVDLSVTNLPVGVTAVLDPETIPAGSGAGTSTLTLTADATAAPTTAASFTVGAVATGRPGLVANTTSTVTVTEAPGFTLAVDPATLEVAAGEAGTSTVTITRTGGFAEAVTLTVANLPTGVTASFDDAAPTGNTAVLTLTADGTAAEGTSTVTVTGTGTPGTATADIALTITAPAGDFALVVDPATLEVEAGGTGTATVNVNKTGTFTGLVTLSATGAPEGVTVTFDPPEASPGSGPNATRDETTTSTATITVGDEVAAGDYTITIAGNAEGEDEATATLTLTVTEAQAATFTIALDPADLSVAAGASGTSTVTVTKTGTFTEDVTLAVTNLPTGVTAAFDPAATSATSALTLTVDAGVAAGEHELTVQGTAPNQPNAEATLTLTVTAAQPATFTLALDPADLSVAAGATGTSTVTVTKTGTFTEDVTLAVTNLPTGVTAAFDPAATSATSVLTLTVDGAVAEGEHELTIEGTAPNQPNAEATLTLTVTAAAASGFALTLDPATLSVQAGTAGTATVNINKTGTFTGPVTLAAPGLPNGFAVAFDPVAASPQRSPSRGASRDVTTTSTMTVAVDQAIAAGDYEITVTGNAEGQEEQSVTLTLTVSGPPGTGNTSVKFCDLDNLPVWVASQDGTGAWAQVTGSVAGDGTTYSFDITQAGGVAYVTGNTTDGFNTFVLYGSQAELIALGNAQCTEAPNASRTLNGTVAGIGASDQVNIAMGGAQALANGALLNFTLNGVLNGAADLFATQSTVAAGPPVAVTPVKMIIRRGLDIADGGSIPVLDFAAAEAFVPQTAVVTLNGLGGTDTPVTFMAYLTATTSGALYTTPGVAGATQTVYGVPAANQQAGDLHALNVIATSATPGDARGHFEWFNLLADKTVNLGPVLNAPTVTAITGSAYPRFQAVAPVQAEYDDSFLFSLSQAARSTLISATKGYLAGATEYTLAIPDLTPAGYDAQWGLATGTPATTSTAAFGFSGTGTTLPREEGGTADFATRGGEVTPAAVSASRRRP